MLHRPFDHHLQQQLAKHGLFRAQWSVLYRLFNDQTKSVGELAKSQFVEKPTMTKIVNRLSEMDLVERVPSKDQREKRIRLTDRGKDLYLEVRTSIDQFEQLIVEGISEDEQKEAVRIMATVRATLTKLGDE